MLLLNKEERSQKRGLPYNSRKLQYGTVSRQANGESKGRDSRLSTYQLLLNLKFAVGQPWLQSPYSPPFITDATTFHSQGALSMVRFPTGFPSTIGQKLRSLYFFHQLRIQVSGCDAHPSRREISGQSFPLKQSAGHSSPRLQESWAPNIPVCQLPEAACSHKKTVSLAFRKAPPV